MRDKLRTAMRWLLAAAMVGAGVAHFAMPEPFLLIMPPYLPWHLELVYLSGLFEIALGVALVVARTRVLAGWGLIALYVAVFPANLHQSLEGITFGDAPLPPLVRWGRLPFQLVLIAWAYWVSRPDREK